MSNSVLKDKDKNILNPKIPRYEKRLRKVLWTNSNPSQEMGADVPINLSSSDYDELEWVFAYSNGANNAISVNFPASFISNEGLTCLVNSQQFGVFSAIITSINENNFNFRGFYPATVSFTSMRINYIACGRWK